MSEKRSGRCLCGAVTFEANIKKPEIHICHCGTCRRWNGGPAMAVECETDIAVSGESKLRWFKSSEWAERGFCSECGSNMFYRLDKSVGEYANISAGTLDDDSGLTVTGHVCIDGKPGYYDFTDDSPRLTEAELMAMFQ